MEQIGSTYPSLKIFDELNGRKDNQELKELFNEDKITGKIKPKYESKIKMKDIEGGNDLSDLLYKITFETTYSKIININQEEIKKIEKEQNANEHNENDFSFNENGLDVFETCSNDSIPNLQSLMTEIKSSHAENYLESTLEKDREYIDNWLGECLT